MLASVAVDGNCLFHSVALALFANESLHLYFLAAVELLNDCAFVWQ